MPPFDLNLTDPSPAAVEAAMADAVKTANGKAQKGLLKADPADYRAFLAAEFAAPEGVMMWLSDQGRVAAYPPTPRGTLLGVVWRTTPLGRAVRVVGRRVEPFQEGPDHRFGPPYRPWPPLCHLDPDHVITRQFAGGEPELIATCACGAVGPPDKLAWEAEGLCGPCHDHAVDTGSPLPAAFGPPALRTEGQLRRVAWLASGARLAAWEWRMTGYRESDSRVAVWERAGGPCRLTTPSSAIDAVAPADLAAGAAMVIGGEVWWVPEAGEPVARFSRPGHGSEVAVSGKAAAALRYDGEMAHRDLSRRGGWKQCWPGRRESNDEYYCAVAFSPNGDKVALGRRAGAVDVLDWPAGTGPTLRSGLPAVADDEYRRVHALAFSPDGKHVAVANGLSGFVEDPSQDWIGWGGSLLLFDVAKGECVAHFRRDRDDILAVAFSPDGSLLFSGATDCQIRVVEVATRREVAVLCGHVGCVNHLAFSPDGETLASAGGDGLVRLWPWRLLLERPAETKRPAAKKRAGPKK